MYRELSPPPALAADVECFWTMEGEVSRPRRNRVVPDGCADIILDLGPGAGQAGRPEAMAVGTMTRPVLGELRGQVSLLGIRFRAGALTPLVGVPATELTDAVVALDAVWRDAASVRDAVASASAVERIPRLVAILRRRLEAQRPRDPVVAAADARLRESQGRADIAALLRDLGVGARRLQRLYATHVGTSPRFAARTYRLRHALRLLRETDAPAVRVALLAGFFDQSHLSRDLRELAGTTPARYRHEQRVASIQSSDTPQT
jgi:AraC-like DNA-binding protein